ncbi:MAG TPA: hypothetical protein VNC22_01430 [Sporichthya sp.]|nr:hypothetical protein [Sporichthya sp.]
MSLLLLLGGWAPVVPVAPAVWGTLTATASTPTTLTATATSTGTLEVSNA